MVDSLHLYTTLVQALSDQIEHIRALIRRRLSLFPTRSGFLEIY